MRLAVASGKGGTGKTSLACALARALGPGTALLDCDVEEPDCALFMKPDVELETEFSVPVPAIDAKACDGCGRCAKVCAYNAIKVFGGKPVLFGHMCHSCGGCALACPRKAISEIPRVSGNVRHGRAGGLYFADGQLLVGEASPVRLIRAVKKISPPALNVIVDCPPGTSCPMIAAVSGANFCLLVSEPTPFGLSDLKLAVETLEKLGVPYGVVINRSDLGDGEMEAWCASRGIKVLMRIPFDRKIAEAYSRGGTLLDASPEYREKLRELFASLPGGAI